MPSLRDDVLNEPFTVADFLFPSIEISSIMIYPESAASADLYLNIMRPRRKSSDASATMISLSPVLWNVNTSIFGSVKSASGRFTVDSLRFPSFP